jgi:hypothetical protein
MLNMKLSASSVSSLQQTSTGSFSCSLLGSSVLSHNSTAQAPSSETATRSASQHIFTEFIVLNCSIHMGPPTATWSRVLLEKLTVARLVKIFLASY